jgi:hypothetical protein
MRIVSCTVPNTLSQMNAGVWRYSRAGAEHRDPRPDGSVEEPGLVADRHGFRRRKLFEVRSCEILEQRPHAGSGHDPGSLG